MAEPINQFSFSAGELSPQLWDRVDIDKYHAGAALMSNFFVDFRGGASNRAGTQYALQCLDSTMPSRVIPFTFSTLQTYALCFGLGPAFSAGVSGAANNGSGAIRLTLGTTVGLMNSNRMTVSGVLGTVEANGEWPIQVIDASHVDLLGSTYQNAYSSGGTVSVNTGAMRVFTSGAPVLNSAVTITSINNNPTGTVTYSGTAPNPGDWVYIVAPGMPRLEGRYAVVTNLNTGANTFQLYDLFGTPIDTTDYGTYAGGGTFSSVYTLAVPYDPNDLAVLKFTQSADVMTFTHTLYQQAQLTRTADNAWTYTPLTFQPTLEAPTGLSVTPSMTGDSTTYNYVVTAVGPNGVTESRASATGTATNSKTMSTTQGAFETLAWTASVSSGITAYNVYRQQEVAGGAAAAGSLYGYVGSTVTPGFVDSNITPDFTRTPPLANDPFAGEDWPGSTTYYQGRQVYAGTADEPDRLVMSRSADFTNMDYSSPSRADDSIDVTLEATQVNAIKHLVPLSVLLALTSSGVWRIDTGDTTQAMTPSNVMARPQSYDGCSDVPPIIIDYEILFVQNLQSTVRAMKYDFLLNLFRADNELTLMSNHLVFNHTIVEWTWAQQPFRLLWCVREDGILLSLTYLPAQNLIAWTQHNTNGQVLSICSIVEGNEHAVYMVVRRLVRGQYVNYVERMASRMFNDVTEAWFVDAGLAYPQVYPQATATPSALSGNATLAAAGHIVSGGQNYSAQTTATVIDAGATTPQAGGSGSNVTLAITNGVITAVTVTPGQGWIRPQIVVYDPTGAGSGAVITPVVQNVITIAASAPVFNAATDVGKVVRISGGVGTVTQVNSQQQITVNLSQPLTTPWPVTAGNWTMTMPVTTVSGLDHLEGCTVACLADGGVQPQQVVTDGAITLTEPADAIVVGLPYTCEIDSLYIDVPTQEQPTTQGKRKKISAVTLRLANSRGMVVGPLGQALYEIKDRTLGTPMGQPEPLYTGDHRVTLDPNFNVQGQIAMVQSDPLPVTLLGFMPELTMGDT
jgi:hypothetical protein